MPSLIALRHVPFEDLDGLAALFERRGFAISYRDAVIDDLAAPALDAADLLVVLGGPISAYEDDLYPFLKPELALIERRLAAERPVLGICLGSQLMARALGARVYASGSKEIGWSPLQLTPAGRTSCLAAIGESHPVLHWHGDTFDLPQGAVHLAATSATRHQAFAWGRHALALQFHIEATARGLERWYVGHALEVATTAGIGVRELRETAARCAPPLLPRAEVCIEAWLDALPLPRREMR